MKIFNWIHGKIHGKQPINKPYSSYPNNNASANYMAREYEKEEFSDWPNGLLAIGTFGNNNNKNVKDPAGDEEELTVEEVGELSKELKLLVHKHSSSSVKDNSNVTTLEKLFDCLQDMEEEDDEEDEEKGSGKSGKEVQIENTNTNISKKSLSSLLKKAILCRGGFNPIPPSLPLPFRDQPLPPEAKLEKSRMEKILRSILHKKIYPQGGSNPRTAMKKYRLDNSLYLCESEEEDDEDGDEEAAGKKAGEGSKWVKTDSDFIVLEI